MNHIQHLLEGMSPPRVSDMIEYLTSSGRHMKCPFCPHDGGWELHLMMPDNGPQEDDPRLMLFQMHTSDELNMNSAHCAGMTCPNCGHFSLVSLYKLAEYQKSKVASNG